MKMTSLLRGSALIGFAALLAGCVVPAPQPPLVVFPGASKTFADFQRDDAACRGTQLAQVGTAVPASPGLGTPNEPVAAPAAEPQAAQATTFAPPPPAYLQCMASRGNAVAPLPGSYGSAYPGYAYPAFVDNGPFFYADGFGFGYGFGYGFGRYGYYGHGGFGRFGGGYGGYGRGGFGGGHFGGGGFGGGGFGRGGGGFGHGGGFGGRRG